MMNEFAQDGNSYHFGSLGYAVIENDGLTIISVRNLGIRFPEMVFSGVFARFLESATGGNSKA
jgi:hypothetical protein